MADQRAENGAGAGANNDAASTLTPANFLTHPLVTKLVMVRHTGGVDAAPPAENPDMSGATRLVVYEDKKLHSDAFCIVHRADMRIVEDDGTSRLLSTVAVKSWFVLRTPDMFGIPDAEAVQQWVDREVFKELNLVLTLSHPNLVQLRCLGVQEVMGVLVPGYAAYQFCCMGSLQAWIADERLSKADVAMFVPQLLDVMAYLHVERCVLHGNLKCSNLFLDRDRQTGVMSLVLGSLDNATQLENENDHAPMGGTPLYLEPCVPAQEYLAMPNEVYTASLVVREIVSGKLLKRTSDATSEEQVDEAVAAAAGIAWDPSIGMTTDIVVLLLRACRESVDTRCAFRTLRDMRSIRQEEWERGTREQALEREELESNVNLLRVQKAAAQTELEELEQRHAELKAVHNDLLQRHVAATQAGTGP